MNRLLKPIIFSCLILGVFGCMQKAVRNDRTGKAGGAVPSSTFLLKWDPSTDAVTHFLIHYGPSQGSISKEVQRINAGGSFNRNSPAAKVTVAKADLTSGEACFTVTAVNNGRSSPVSDPQCAALPKLNKDNK